MFVSLVKGGLLDTFLEERLAPLRAHHSADAVAYVAGVLKAQVAPRQGEDLSHKSVVLEFQAASFAGDFARFQRLGDWVLWACSVFPQSVENNREIIVDFGQRSYSACYRLLRGQWKVYAELASELPSLTQRVRLKLM